MKLVTYVAATGAPRIGSLVEGDVIVDLAEAARRTEGGHDPAFASMQALIEAGPAALDRARALSARPQDATLARRHVRLLSPIPTPIQMRDFLCFETHMRNAGFSAMRLRAQAEGGEPALAAAEQAGPPPIPPVWHRQPIYYKCNRFSVAGTEHDVRMPAATRLPDYELEMAVVVSRGGRDITVREAPSHIFGYTILNDFTARDLQLAEMEGRLGPAKGKDFDGANILGPYLVTADEVPDPYDLRMRAWVNGELWSDGHSGSIRWSFADMIAHVSRDETIHAGEVFGSGTVGDGCGFEQLRFLAHEDVVELEIEGLGRLRNRVLAPQLARRGARAHA